MSTLTLRAYALGIGASREVVLHTEYEYLKSGAAVALPPTLKWWPTLKEAERAAERLHAASCPRVVELRVEVTRSEFGWRRCDMKCARCLTSMVVYSMSWFNRDMVCPSCSEQEQAHPDFAYARAAEEAAVKQDDFNFPGVGWPGVKGRVPRSPA